MMILYLDLKNQTIGINDPQPGNENRVVIQGRDSIPLPVFIESLRSAQSTKNFELVYEWHFGK